MRWAVLNLNWLQTFVTLVDTGHFTHTAEKLFMTQPGVSQHINKLESACGHALILREKKSFDLTEQGRLVYQYAQQLLMSEQHLFEQLIFDNPDEGECKLACSGALALMLYPKLLSVQAEHRKLVMQLKAAPNHEILNAINTGDIDLGIVTNMSSDAQKSSDFTVEQVGHEALCLILPVKYEAQPITEQLLIDLGLISHPDAKHYLSLYFSQSQLPFFTNTRLEEIPKTGFVNQINQILLPVAKGLGFTVLPQSIVDSFNDQESLTIFKPDKPVIEMLYLVKKRNRVLPARFEQVSSLIKSSLLAQIE